MESVIRVKKHTTAVRQGAIALLTLLLCLSASAQVDRINLPDMGNSAENFLSDGEEKQYAEAIIMQLRAYGVLVDDPLISAYFKDMGFRLVSASDKPDQPFTFVVLDEHRVNAFAAPGGVVALHSGLILTADNENEVAGVLAHEVAHITQLHLYRTLENSQRMTIPIALGMLAIALAGGGSGQAITGALASGQAMAAQMMINFTRANEVEADRVGITTLSLAGYDPQGMVTFFDKMGKLSRASGQGPPEFLRTHPVSVNRIAEAKNRAALMPVPEPSNGLNFYLAQARIRALLEAKPNDAIAWFRDRIDEEATEVQLMAHQYGLAIALQRKRQFDEARRLLGRLLDENPAHRAFQLQLADLDMDDGREEQALASLASLYHTFPGNHAISVQYSEALLKDKDPQRAETASVILRQQLLHRDDDPVLYELFAQSANIAGDQVRASEALAEAYFLQGGVKEAMQQLEMLTRRDDLDYYQRARVTARLEEMRIIMGELGDEDIDS
jgi:predicted Zn-dependent protease